MIGNWGINMNRIHRGIFEQFRIVGVAFLDSKIITDALELVLVALADGVAIGVGMLLPERDEFCAKAEADDGDVKFSVAHKIQMTGQIFPLRLRKIFKAKTRLRKCGA